MGFTLTGVGTNQSIIQTGADNTASFLANIGSNGATVTTYGNTPHSTFHIVNFGSNSLIADGDLDIDFNRFIFIFTGTDDSERLYARNGSIKLRSVQTENGFTFNPEVGTVIFAIEGDTVEWNSRTLKVDSAGAKSYFTGVTFKGEFSAWIYGNARFENCIAEKIGNTGDIQFNVEGDTELVNFKKYDSGQTGITFRNDSRNVLIDNVQVFGARDSFNNESDYPVVVEKLDSDTGAVADIAQYYGERTIVKNAKNGTRFLWANHLNGGNPTVYRDARLEVVQDLTITAVDLSGNNVQDAVFYMVDNPQLAVADNTAHTLEYFDNQSAKTQRTYIKTTDSNGVIPKFPVLIGEGLSGSGDPRNGKIRGRGKNPKAFYFAQLYPDDIFNYLFLSYLHIIINNDVVLKGEEGAFINAIFIDDSLITNPDRDAIDALKRISNAKELFDRAKSFCVANNIEMFLTRIGDVIYAGSYNVEFRSIGFGDSVFEFDGTTIRIGVVNTNDITSTAEDKFEGSIDTSGTITGEEFINGGYKDSTGTFVQISMQGAEPSSRAILFNMDGIRSSDWESVTQYSLGDFINPTSNPDIVDLLYFECIQAGASYTSRPDFNVNEGEYVVDGATLWEAKSVVLANDTFDANGEYSVIVPYKKDISVLAEVYYVNGLTAKDRFEQFGTLTDAGLSFTVTQSDNDAYINGNVDGATVTECTVDASGKVQVDIDDDDNVTSVQRIRNWFEYQSFLGVPETLFPSVTGDAANPNFTGGLTIENLDLVNTLFIVGGIMQSFNRAGDRVPITDPNGGHIEWQPSRIYVADTSLDLTPIQTSVTNSRDKIIARIESIKEN